MVGPAVVGDTRVWNVIWGLGVKIQASLAELLSVLDLGQRLDGAERLRDVAEFEDGSVVSHVSGSSSSGAPLRAPHC